MKEIHIIETSFINTVINYIMKINTKNMLCVTSFNRWFNVTIYFECIVKSHIHHLNPMYHLNMLFEFQQLLLNR